VGGQQRSSLPRPKSGMADMAHGSSWVQSGLSPEFVLDAEITAICDSPHAIRSRYSRPTPSERVSCARKARRFVVRRDWNFARSGEPATTFLKF